MGGKRAYFSVAAFVLFFSGSFVVFFCCFFGCVCFFGVFAREVSQKLIFGVFAAVL